MHVSYLSLRLLVIAVIIFQCAPCDAFSLSPATRSRVVHYKPPLKPNGNNKNSFQQGLLQRSSSTTTTTCLKSSADAIATGLGYLVGAGSLVLYTPIAIRVVRQQSAQGLVASTWWLKLASYTTSDIYFFQQHYPVSTYVETLVITVEAAVILGLVTFYQGQTAKPGPEQEDNNQDSSSFFTKTSAYLAATFWGLTLAPPAAITLGQAASALLNTGALIPQFAYNAQTKSSGDYSPLTAGLAAGGCLIRLFTTIQLADSDPVLLGTFGLALVLNGSLLGQILYYGVTSEQQSISSLLMSDFTASKELPMEEPKMAYPNDLRKEKEEQLKDPLKTTEKEREIQRSLR